MKGKIAVLTILAAVIIVMIFTWIWLQNFTR